MAGSVSTSCPFLVFVFCSSPLSVLIIGVVSWHNPCSIWKIIHVICFGGKFCMLTVLFLLFLEIINIGELNSNTMISKVHVLISTFNLDWPLWMTSNSNAMFRAPSRNRHGARFYGTAAVSDTLFFSDGSQHGNGAQRWNEGGCNKCWKLTNRSGSNRTTIVVRGTTSCPPGKCRCDFWRWLMEVWFHGFVSVLINLHFMLYSSFPLPGCQTCLSLYYFNMVIRKSKMRKWQGKFESASMHFWWWPTEFGFMDSFTFW